MTPLSIDRSALYLDLMKRVLRGSESQLESVEVRATNWKRYLLAPLQSALRTRGYRIVSSTRHARFDGETMMSRDRLDNIQACVESVIADGVPGDLIETGVWRGGGAIFMRAILAAHGITDRTVWVADSFQGFPAPTARSQAIDQEVDFTAGMGDAFLSVDLETVKSKFRRYGLLDAQVQFLAGWFADTLPAAPLEQLAVLRLDGDMYESTWDALSALYPKLSVGGYVILDDYGFWEPCRRAADDFRRRERISDPIQDIDGEGVYWRRQG
jgi:O-methyltransferase